MISDEVKDEIRKMFAAFAGTMNRDELFAAASGDWFIEADSFYNDFVERICHETYANGCSNGVSKLVLFFNGKGYVVKIPILGYYYIEDEDDVTYHYENAPEFDSIYPYGYNGFLAKSDYCMSEAKAFIELDRLGFGDMVAETDYVCMAGDFPVYVSNRASAFDPESWKTTYYPSASSYGVSSTVYSKFVSSYGLDRTNAFFDALDCIGIADLHDGNFGIVGDGRIVLLDYSDFME